MSMRLRRCPNTCTRKLTHGEAKRVPRDLLRLSGYHVGCPGCGRPQAISVTSTPMLEESPGELLSTEAVVCDACGVRFRIVRDEVVTLGS